MPLRRVDLWSLKRLALPVHIDSGKPRRHSNSSYTV
jgi:hypothetical protein